MVIRLTEKCRMECTHCMYECTANRENHMSNQTLYKIVNSALFKKSSMIVISGGEPTEHPQFLDFFKFIVKNTKKSIVQLISNGMFTENEYLTKQIINVLDNNLVFLQITHDKRFYKKEIKRINHERIEYVDEISSLTYLGRAQNFDKNDYPKTQKRQYPMCFNARSLLIGMPEMDFIDYMTFMEQKNKYCTMVFAPNGDLSASECGNYIITNIHNKDFFKKLRNPERNHVPCNKCGLWNYS